MVKVNASPGRAIEIGYQGENQVTQVRFRYNESWLACGSGEFKIRILRPGDTEAYNAEYVVDDRETMTLSMTVTDVELSAKGCGEMQVVYIGEDFIKKSPVYRYSVSRAIDGEVVDPPEGSIINQIVREVSELSTDVGEMQTEIRDIAETAYAISMDVGNMHDALLEKADTSYVDDQLSGKASTEIATTSADGLMSAADKTKLDAVYNDYTAALIALGDGT